MNFIQDLVKAPETYMGIWDYNESIAGKKKSIHSFWNSNVQFSFFVENKVNIEKLIEILIRTGNDINKRLKDTLHHVASLGLIEIAELLIHHGALIEEKTWIGLTPLHFAIQHNQKEMV